VDSSAGCRNRKPFQTRLGGISRAEVASHQNSVWVLRGRPFRPTPTAPVRPLIKVRKTQGPHEFFPSMLPPCGCPRILDRHEADDGLRPPCNDNTSPQQAFSISRERCVFALSMLIVSISQPVLGNKLQLMWAFLSIHSLVQPAGQRSRGHISKTEAVTKLVPSAKGDSICSAFAFPALPSRAFRCRPYATGVAFVRPSPFPSSFATASNHEMWGTRLSGRGNTWILSFAHDDSLSDFGPAGRIAPTSAKPFILTAGVIGPIICRPQALRDSPYRRERVTTPLPRRNQ